MRTAKTSIRLRLTAWYAAVLIIILGIAFTGIYLHMRNKLESMAQDNLDDGFATVETVLKNSGGDIYDVYHLGHEAMFRVKQDDKLLYRTHSWNDAQLKRAFGKGPSPTYYTWRAPDGRFLMMRSGKVTDYEFELSLAIDITSTRESIRTLGVLLLAGIPGGIVLALAGGHFLAGRALSPIKAITDKAREISADRLSERLPVPNPDDEVGRLANVFNHTLARLEESFEHLRRFTADASHELRTPLTSMRSVGEVTLQGSPDKDVYREAIGSMLEEVEHLTRLVDNLLTLARGDRGKTPLDPRPIDLTALVEKLVDNIHILAEEKDQELILKGSPAIRIVADEEIIELAINNVLHNAITYTPAGGHIDVQLSAGDAGGAVIDIIDDGPGIPVEQREKVFERFYRIDKARSRAEGGAGLGLSIARWAIEVNNGHIEFLDRGNSGTWCRITLRDDPRSH